MLNLQERCIGHLESSLDAALVKIGILLQERDSLKVLLGEKYQVGQDVNADDRRRQMVKTLVGEGWDLQKEEQNFQKSKSQLLAYVRALCGADTMKQQQLCEALYHRYSTLEDTQAAKKSKADKKLSLAHAGVVAGIQDLFKRLSGRNGGRYKHNDRVLHNAMATAAVWKAGC